MKKDLKTIEECARCFIRRIGSPLRRSKQVDLFHEGWDGSLVDLAWVKGALSTTALRKRPHGVAKPQGSLGYKAAEQLSKDAAADFYRALAQNESQNYGQLLSRQCRDLEQQILEQTNLHWTFGRSQKFYNILTKYWYCAAMAYPDKLKESDRNLVLKNSQYFHAAVDSITIKHLKKAGASLQLEGFYWGWNMTESLYDQIQEWFASHGGDKWGSAVAYELVEVW